MKDEDQWNITSRIADAIDEANAIIGIDDDAWHLAMTRIRNIAWEGKELVHAKRLAAYEPKRARRVAVHSAINDLIALGFAPDEIVAAMQSVRPDAALTNLLKENDE